MQRSVGISVAWNALVVCAASVFCSALPLFISDSRATSCTVKVAQQMEAGRGGPLLRSAQAGVGQVQPLQLVVAKQPANAAPKPLRSNSSVVIGSAGRPIKIGPDTMRGSAIVELGAVARSMRLGKATQAVLIDAGEKGSAPAGKIGKNGC